MITPNQSEILGLSLRTIIKCCTTAGTLSGRSRLSETGNQLYTCYHSVCSGYTDIQWQFLLVKTGDKSDLGTEITIPLDKQGCSSLDWTVQLLLSLGERMDPAASPGASAAADPGEKRNTELLLHQWENGSSFRLKHVLVTWNSSTCCLLPNYSSAPTTNWAGQRLPPTVCCPPRSQQQDAAFTLQVRFPLPSGLCYVFREKISFTGSLPWRKEAACYFCSLQGWWYSMPACLLSNYLLRLCGTRRKSLLTATA